WRMSVPFPLPVGPMTSMNLPRFMWKRYHEESRRAPAFFLIFAERCLRIHLPDKVEHHVHGDEECGTAHEYGGYAGETLDDERNDRHQAEEERARKRDARHHVADVLLGFLSWTYAGHEGS